MLIALPSSWTTTMFLPDINLWLALAFELHVHHAAAKNWFDGATNDGCCFCRLRSKDFCDW